MQSRIVAACALALCCSLAACGGIVDPSQNTVETFTGTIPVGGQSPTPHGFTASKNGEISVKVTALSPSSSSTFVGVAWTGRSADGTCTPGALGGLYAQTTAQVGFPAISTQIQSGGYCILLYDVGSFTSTVSYTVTVSHP